MRIAIQTALNTLSSIDAGAFIPESVIESGVTYFGYELQENYVSSSYDRNDVTRVTIIGFVMRKVKSNENTLQIVDDATVLVKNELSKLNFKVSTQDVSMSNDIRKIKVTGVAYVYGKTFVY